jgi:DNA-binding beta-propeller fold protein YncE
VDEDGDGSPQDCDPCFGNDAFGDADGDGVCDRASDTDGDGCLNAIDSDNTTAGTDSDSDGFADECDFCPSDATSACAAWMVSRSAPYLYYFDTTTLEAQYEVALTESTGTITIEGLNGLAVDPVTSTPYVVAKALSSRHLASLDLSTASLTVIGDLGDNVSDIAFDAAGTLYAVTGDGADIPNELYTVDLATGAMTSFATLGNGNDGEALAYCPDDGLMYHLSGTGSTMVFESIDLSTSTVTSLGRDYDTSEAISFHWDDSMSAFLINFRSGNGSYLDTTGVDSELGTWSGGGVVTSGITDYRYKGMVIVQ